MSELGMISENQPISIIQPFKVTVEWKQHSSVLDKYSKQLRH